MSLFSPMKRIVNAAAACTRSYYARPALTTPLITIQSALRGKKVSLGSPLNPHERPQKSAAKRDGFLLMKNSCSKPLTTEYFRYCMARRRPYIAVAKDGATVHVDLRSVAGPARLTDEGHVKKVASAFQEVIDRSKWSVQIVNDDTLEEQKKRVTPGAREGSNDGKVRDTVVADNFTVHTTCRDTAVQLATSLNSAFVAAVGLPTAEQLHAEKMDRVAEKQARRRRLLLRRLTRLAADPIASRNLRVKAGVLDGFIRATKEGPVS